MSGPVDGDTLNTENPWPGLDSFSEGGQGFFHGRDSEIAECMRLIRRETLTVLFGQSGLGKTSLLRAGVFPQLRQEDYLPVYIRLDVLNTDVSLSDQVKQEIVAECAEYQIEARAPEAKETLWQYFHTDDVDFWNRRNRLVTPVLVFDQFEEIFTLTSGGSQDARQAFLDELADLIEGRPSSEVREAIEADEAESTRYNFAKRGCKVVLSFREDYLPDFEGLRSLIPSIMTNRMRLIRMNSAQAMEVVHKGRDNLVDAEVAERIVRFVGSRRTSVSGEAVKADELSALEVEPALLSVVCRELNIKRLAVGQPRITADLLEGAQDEIIVSFYRSSLEGIDPRVQAFIEDHLLTAGGYRNSAALDDALTEPGVSQEAIDTLITRRLIRAEERFGTHRIELTHDLLTKVIKEERDRRRAREEERQQQAELLAQQRRRQRRMLAVGGALVGVVAVAIAGIVYFNALSRQYERERNQLLGYMAQSVSDMSTRLRLIPGTSSVILDMTRDIDAFAERFRLDLEDRGLLGIGDSAALLRLDATALIVKAYQRNVEGNLTDALAQLELASEKLGELSKEAPDDSEIKATLSDLWNTRGLTYRLQARAAESYQAYQRSVEIARELYRSRPDVEPWRRKLSMALSGAGAMASALRKSKDVDKIIEERKAIIDVSLKKEPESETWQREKASFLWMEASRLMQQAGMAKDAERERELFNDALVLYEKQRSLLVKLIRSGASDWRTRFYLSFSDFRLGSAYVRAGRLDEAEKHLEQAQKYIVNLKVQDPANSFWRIVSAYVHNMLGELYLKKGEKLTEEGETGQANKQFAQAVSAYEVFRDDRVDIRKRDPGNLSSHRELAEAHHKLAGALEKTGNVHDATAEYRTAIRTFEEYRKMADGVQASGPAAEKLGEDLKKVDAELNRLTEHMKVLEEQALRR